MGGEYGMTQHAIGIPVSEKDDADVLAKALASKEFKSITDACSWSNFRIDWRMFKDFKDGWWRDFL